MAESKKEAVRNALPRKPENTQDHIEQLGIRAETLRILEPSVPAPPVSLKKTEPQLPALEIGQTSQVTVAPSGVMIGAFDSIPRWFCWGLLGISSLIFLLEIWNYALS